MKFMLPAALAAILSLTAGAPLFAETNYTVFKVCEDQHVIRTSDGAEAGHVEYIVFDPAEQRIVSSVVSGGSLGERLVAVPFTSMRFGSQREVVLTEITRERLVSAPVIERTQITTTARFEPAVVERSFTHFGVRVDATARTSTSGRETDQRRNAERSERRGDPAVSAQSQLRDNTERDSATADGTRERMARERQGDNSRPNAERDGRRGDGDRDRSRPSADAARDDNRPPGGEARRNDARPEGTDSNAGARRNSAETNGATATPKADSAPQGARAATQDAARKARDVKGEATSKVESATGAASEAAGANARKAAKGAERATESSATDAARKVAPAKAETESRPPNAESRVREKNDEKKEQ